MPDIGSIVMVTVGSGRTCLVSGSVTGASSGLGSLDDCWSARLPRGDSLAEDFTELSEDGCASSSGRACACAVGVVWDCVRCWPVGIKARNAAKKMRAKTMAGSRMNFQLVRRARTLGGVGG